MNVGRKSTSVVKGRRTRNLNSSRQCKSCATCNYLGLSETDSLPSLQVWPEIGAGEPRTVSNDLDKI